MYIQLKKEDVYNIVNKVKQGGVITPTWKTRSP